MKRYIIGILFVATVGLAIVYWIDQKEKKEKVDELKKNELILQEELDKLKKDRILADEEIDSLKAQRIKIKERIRTVKVYVPGKFDTLFNKKLQAVMLDEYRNFNQ